jgi:hypothetical protein
MERPLDEDRTTLTLSLSDGSVVNKEASGGVSMEIYNILLPYLKNNQT